VLASVCIYVCPILSVVGSENQRLSPPAPRCDFQKSLALLQHSSHGTTTRSHASGRERRPIAIAAECQTAVPAMPPDGIAAPAGPTGHLSALAVAAGLAAARLQPQGTTDGGRQICLNITPSPNPTPARLHPIPPSPAVQYSISLPPAQLRC
jgi:hypothetical protein